jgi:hypothetical protein
MRIHINVTQADIDVGQGGDPSKCMVVRAVKRHTAPGVSVIVGIPREMKMETTAMHVCLRNIAPDVCADPMAPIAPEEMCALPPDVQTRIWAFDRWYDRLITGGDLPARPEPFDFELEVPAVYLNMTVPTPADALAEAEAEHAKREEVRG